MIFAMLVFTGVGAMPTDDLETAEDVRTMRREMEDVERLQDVKELEDGPRFAKIFGGYEVDEGLQPYMVFFTYSREQDMRGPLGSCSAGLVGPGLVLLAAHCFQDKPVVVAGVILAAGRADLAPYRRARLQLPFAQPVEEHKFGVQERRACQVEIHPQYNPTSMHHDLALIRLQTPFQLSDTVAPLSLATAQMKAETSCKISGWGRSEGDARSFRLKSADGVTIQPVADEPFLRLFNTGRQFCAGDSGGPLVCDGHVWGVISFVMHRGESTVCGEAEEAYLAELWPDLGWLQDNMVPCGARDTRSAPRPLLGISILVMLLFIMIPICILTIMQLYKSNRLRQCEQKNGAFGNTEHEYGKFKT